MPDSYHEWKDRELLLDHEANPESFRQPIITKPCPPKDRSKHTATALYEAQSTVCEQADCGHPDSENSSGN